MNSIIKQQLDKKESNEMQEGAERISTILREFTTHLPDQDRISRKTILEMRQ